MYRGSDFVIHLNRGTCTKINIVWGVYMGNGFLQMFIFIGELGLASPPPFVPDCNNFNGFGWTDFFPRMLEGP